MPEYLAPGVYVEEVPSGSKPIEGASTSTAAMVGMTQRGPVNVPTLVTSFGNFTRTFGGYLHPDLFSEGRDALPYAADGFFTNGGSRVYITRIVGAGADESTLMLSALAAGEAAGARTLSAAAQAGAASIEVANPAGIAAGDLLVIADGTRSESVTVAALNPTLLLAGPLANDYATGNVVTLETATAIVGVLQADLAAGDTQLSLDDATGVAVGAVLWLRDSGADRGLDEFLTVSAVTPGPTAAVDFAPALANDHLAASTLSVLADSATTVALSADTVAGRDPAVLPVPSGAGFSADSVIRITDGAAANELAVLTAVQTRSGLGQPRGAAGALPCPGHRRLPHGRGARSPCPVARRLGRQSQGLDARGGAGRHGARRRCGGGRRHDPARDGVRPVPRLRARRSAPRSTRRQLTAASTTAEVASVNATTGSVTLTAPLGTAYTVVIRRPRWSARNSR